MRQAPNALRRALRHPSWIAENTRGIVRRRREARREFSLQPYGELFAAEANAVARVTGEAPERYRAILEDFPDTVASENPGDLPGENVKHPLFGGRRALVRIVYGVVRLCSPETMVETGVAQGVTTAAILQGMERNGRGALYSIDLPVLYADEEEFVGRLVPAAVKHRWSLKLGPSRALLPRLVDEVAPLDAFLHDADHSYEAQLEEYSTVWPKLRPGGVMLSDDVENPAFPEFAEQVGVRAILVGDIDGTSVVGLLRKPD